MADLDTLRIGMDVSGLRSGASQLSQILAGISNEFKSVIVTSIASNEANKAIAASFRAVGDGATELNVKVQLVEDGLKQLSKILTPTTAELKRLKEAQNEGSESAKKFAQAQKDAASDAALLMSKIAQPGAGTSGSNVAAFRRVQEQLKEAFAENILSAGDISAATFQKLYADVRKNVILLQPTEALTSLQKALMDMLQVDKNINKERKKQEESADALNKKKEAALALTKAEQEAAQRASQLMGTLTQPDVKTTAGTSAAFRRAQDQLKAAFTGAIVAGVDDPTIQRLFDNVKNKIILPQPTEALARLQAALQSALSYNERITREKEKQSKLTDAEAAKTSLGQLAKVSARDFIGREGLGPQPGDSPALLAGFRAAQQQLIKGIYEQYAGKEPIVGAADQLAKIRKGDIAEEIGANAKVQAGLLALVRLGKMRADEAERLVKATEREAALLARQVQTAAARGFRQEVQSQLPIPAGTTTAQLATYQQRLSQLQRAAAQTNLSQPDLGAFYRQVRTTPAVDLSQGTTQLANLQTAINRTTAAYEQLGKSGTEAGDRMGVSFARLATILQIQLVHRVFGNLINEITGSITQAAALQVKLSEIQTVAQRSGIPFQGFQQQIRALSDEFGRPQTDIAEAAYQGFSNQIIRTQGDMGFLNEAMRFSRITVSSATDSVNLLSSVLNSYRLPVTEARRVSDELFATIDIGRVRTADLANTFGRVGVTAHQLGISFEETAGSIAVLTQRGVSPSEAMTQMSAVMQGLIRPTRELQQYFRQLGVTTGAEFINASGGFVGALRRIMQAVESGNVSIGDLENNIRAIRGVFGLTGDAGAELTRVIGEITNSTERANEAFRLVGATAGDQFNREIIKIKNMFINDFGNVLVEQILRMAAPFGGLSNMVKELANVIMTFIQIGIRVGNTIAAITGFLNQFGITIARVVQGILVWRAAILAISVAKSTWIFLLQQQTATIAVSSFTVGVHTNMIQGMTAAAAAQGGVLTSTTAQVSNYTRAVNFATASLQNLRIIATGVFAGFVIGTAIFSLAEYINHLTQARDLTRQVAEEVRGLERAHRNQAIAANTVIARENRAYREDIASRANILLAANRQNILAAEALRDRQRELWRQSTENLRVAGRGVAEEMQTIISRIRNDISQAYSAIETSRRRLASARDKDIAEVFKQTLSAAAQTGRIERATVGQSLAAPNLSQEQYEEVRNNIQRIREDSSAAQQAFELQNRLISNRIGQLIRDAHRLEQTGNREDIESARRKYDEIDGLLVQQHELRIANDRAQLSSGLQVRAMETGQAQRGQVDINLRPLEGERARIRQLRETGERNFVVLQSQSIANSHEQLVLERQRAQRIEDTQRQLAEFTVLDREGNLQERFRGPRGRATAEADFRRLAEAARRALGPVELTGEEIISLTQRLGETQANVIRDALARGQLSAEQRIQLEGSVTVARAQQLAQQLADHRINSVQITQFNREVAAQQIQLIQILAREQQVANANALQIRIRNQAALANEERVNAERAITASREAMAGQIGSSLTAINVVRENVRRNMRAAMGLREGSGAAEGAVQAAIARFQPFVDRANDAVRALDAIQGRPGATAQEIRAAAEVADRALNALAQEERRILLGRAPIVSPAVEAARNIAASANSIAAADEAFARTTRAVEKLQAQVNALPFDLRRAATTAVEESARFARGLDPVISQTNSLAQAITNLANAFRAMGINPANVPRPVVGVPLPPAVQRAEAEAAQERRAAGGLLGNVFASRGPDDMLIAARRGEFVVNPASTRRFYPQLVAINAGTYDGYAQGGLVSNTTNVGDISIKVDGSGSPEETARTVLAKIRREIRRGN